MHRMPADATPTEAIREACLLFNHSNIKEALAACDEDVFEAQIIVLLESSVIRYASSGYADANLLSSICLFAVGWVRRCRCIVCWGKRYGT